MLELAHFKIGSQVNTERAIAAHDCVSFILIVLSCLDPVLGALRRVDHRIKAILQDGRKLARITLVRIEFVLTSRVAERVIGLTAIIVAETDALDTIAREFRLGGGGCWYSWELNAQNE